jgi:hypothetical protein
MTILAWVVIIVVLVLPGVAGVVTQRWLNRQDSQARAYLDDAYTALEANQHAEECAARIHGDDPNAYVDRVLTLREERVQIFRRLGWNKEAEKLAADTAMRRSWPTIDTTPLAQPTWTSNPED